MIAFKSIYILLGLVVSLKAQDYWDYDGQYNITISPSCQIDSSPFLLFGSIHLINCEKSNLPQIPEVISTNPFTLEIFSLSFAHNNIREILKNLYSEILVTKTSSTFSDALCVQVLDLSFNKISEIQDEAFIQNRTFYSVVGNHGRSFPCLQKLILANNHLTSRNLLQLKHLEKIRTLNLNSNYFPVIQKDFFDGFPELEELDLGNCSISTIEPNSFITLESLVTLNLQMNLLKFIEPNTFSGLPNLELLDLSFMPHILYNNNSFNGLLSNPRISKLPNIL